METEKKISLREHQLIMLNILIEFVSFCDKYGLKYYLDAGTLLGAVRHKGFIPWDNDIDLCMLRDDYEKMLQIVKRQNGMINEHLILEMPENTIYCFAKIGDIRTKLIEFPDTYPEECYIYIDIFPKDGIADLGIFERIVCKISEILGMIHWFNKHSIPYWSEKKKGIYNIIARIFNKVIKNKNWAIKAQHKLIEKYRRSHPISKCKYLTTLVNGEYNGCCPKKCWEKSIKISFENRQFYAPVDYDTWMCILYGKDYMTPPPPEKQRIHKVYAYIKEEK